MELLAKLIEWFKSLIELFKNFGKGFEENVPFEEHYPFETETL